MKSVYVVTRSNGSVIAVFSTQRKALDFIADRALFDPPIKHVVVHLGINWGDGKKY